MALYVIFADLWFWWIPQPVSLSLFGQNSRGYIRATPWYIDIKFTGYVDTLSGCCKKLSKLGVTPKFGPQGGSNFQIGPHCGPLADKFTHINQSHKLRLVEPSTSLKTHRIWDPDPLHVLYRQRRKWRILWNFANLTSFGREGKLWQIIMPLGVLREGMHLYKSWKFHGNRSTNFWENALQTCTQKVCTWFFFTHCDFLLNVAFLRGPYPETVHHVRGFM